MRRVALVALAVFAVPLLAPSQTFSFQSDRMPVVELAGHFRFHTGDDPDGKLGWSAPGFDDSSWQLLRSGEDWFNQGYRNYGGMAWYRFTVTLPAEHPPLALYVPAIRDSFQIFVNGRLIGENGGMPPHAKVIIANRLVFPIPPDAVAPGQPLVFAIRVWHWPHWAMYFGGGPSAALRIGDVPAIREWQTVQYRQLFWRVSAESFLLLIEFLAGLAGLALFVMHLTDREYLWFGIYEMFQAAQFASSIGSAFYSHWLRGPEIAETGFSLVAYVCFTAFAVSIVRQRRGFLFWMAIASLAAYLAAFVVGSFEWISVSLWNATMSVAILPYIVAILALLAAGARRGIRDAQLLLFPLGLAALVNILENTLWVIYSSGYTAIGPWRDRMAQTATWPFPMSLSDMAEFLTQLAMLAILVLRFTRTRRDEQRHASELEAARTVQQVLIPEEIPTIPGFAIQCVYKPAGEVSGDFFQIIPAPAGGVLAVIGDVSGKGMPAAMAVSLLVGTFRTLAHYTQSPGEILAAMNQRMIGRSGGGFTTCFVLLAENGGSLTLANAGHLTPYRNGEEVPLDSGLPLGVAAETSYRETTLPLEPGDTLTLLSDGVVEARDSAGDLFGFERTRAISTQSAESIANAAQTFGQDDDITVLTLTLAPAEVLHA